MYININATPFYSGCWPFVVIGYNLLFKMVFVCEGVFVREVRRGWKKVVMRGIQFGTVSDTANTLKRNTI